MITQDQKLSRTKYLGSSEAAAILGLDPFMSASDVWLLKTGRAEEFAGNEHTDRGELLEPALLRWARDYIGEPFSTDVMRVHASELLCANFDGISPPVRQQCCDPFIVEAKTSVKDEDWGEEGTDAVPEKVICQTHHQFAVAGPQYRVAWVPVLIPTYRCFSFRMYWIERRDDIVRMVEEAGIEFMEKHVRTDTPPDDFRPSLEVAKRIRRTPNKTVALDDLTVQLWRSAVQRRKEAEMAENEAKALLLAQMQDAEGATCDHGEVTYYEQKRKGYTVPEASYRVLRFKEAT